MANKYHGLMASVAWHCSAWIAPDGKFHAVPECGHERYAREVIFNLEESKDEYAFWQHPGAVRLEAQGWLHISYGSVKRCDGKPTQKQIDTLFDFAMVAESLNASRYAQILRETTLEFIAAS